MMNVLLAFFLVVLCALGRAELAVKLYFLINFIGAILIEVRIESENQ